MKKSKATAGAVESLEHSPSHLLHRVLQIALDIYATEAGENALTQRQYAVLKALDGTEGQSQADLVRVTGIDRSTLADMVSRMLTKGLLERERSASDARANLVRVSAQGKAALDDMLPRVLSADEKILALLSPPKRQSFVKLLRKITAARDGGVVTADDAAGKAKSDKPKAEKKKKKDSKAKKPKSGAKKLREIHMDGTLPMPVTNQGAVAAEDKPEQVTAP